MYQRYALALITAISLAACSAGHGGVVPAGPSLGGSGSMARPSTRGTLTVRVKVPHHPHSLSPSTKAISIKITGPTPVTVTAGLEVKAAGCTSSVMNIACTLTIPNLTPCPNTHACYTGSVTTYDKFNASTGKIPGNAHKLSAELGFTFNISATNTLVPLVLEGLPKTIAFLPAPSSNLSGSQSTGYVEPKCSTKPDVMNVVGLDADGNYILGVGAPKVTLASNDSAQLAVTGSITQANVFTLRPPAAPNYAFGGHTTQLTATATPGSKSGGSAVHATLNVTYSGDICGVISEFSVPTASAEPFMMGAGPDGNVWFSELLSGKIARVTPTGTITEFSLLTANAEPTGIVTGPDGNLWVLEANANKIARVTPAGVDTTEYPITTPGAAAIRIVNGPDGNLWFTETSASKVAKVTTNGVVTEYPVTAASSPLDIVTGPDGNLWYTESANNKIGTITTTGSFADDALPAGTTDPIGIVNAPNGALWYTGNTSNNIGDITTAAATPTTIVFPEAASGPAFLVVGPDQNLWVTEFTGNRIAKITIGGTITEYAIPTPTAQAYGILLGPDGAIWFAETGTNKVGRIR